MLNLKIVDQYEKELNISKQNKILILNKLKFAEFYSFFYRVIKLKEKSVLIYLGNKLIDNKSVNLFSFMDITEILEQMNFKKGTLLYEYFISCFRLEENIDVDILLYDLVDIVKSVINNSGFDIDYEINEDVEKMLFSLVDFKLNYSFDNVVPLFLKILEDYLEKNNNKINIIFYDSELIDCDVSKFDSCYVFDISDKKDFTDYNILCWEKIDEFSLDSIMERLELLWPVEFDEEEVKESLINYFHSKRCLVKYKSKNETDIIVEKLLNKIYEQEDIDNFNNIIIRDNVKSFLEQI